MTKTPAQTIRLEWLIQLGLLIIVALMPFHAFLSVWLGSLTHHQAIIQAWKEALLLVLAAGTAALLWHEPARLKRLKQPWVLAAAAFTIIAVVVTLIAKPPLAASAFGLKTDLEFLLAGIIALVVSTPKFIRRLIAVVLAGAALVTGFDVLQIFVLPANFLTHFGYGPSTILPYETISEGTRALRFPATLGGPNQLGTYLILPLALSLLLARRRPWLLVLSAAALISLFATYSRAAWLGAALAVCYCLFFIVPVFWRKRLAWGLGLAAVVGLLALPLLISSNGPLQYVILHSSAAAHDEANRSDSQHVSSLKAGLTADLSSPLGHGLGTAGPATLRVGQTNIIENYFLQIGYETGWLGLLAFLASLGLLVKTLARRTPEPLAVGAIAALAGVSVAALVLPAWADSSTALVVWICAGACTSEASGDPNV